MTVDPPRFGHAGLTLDAGPQLSLLDELRGDTFQALFRALRVDPAINTGWPRSMRRPDVIHNGYFPMILRERPAIVIEIGSGFSTRVARKAIEHGGLDTKLVVFDPEPRSDVRQIADRWERLPVEASRLAEHGVPDGALLMIDSSHGVVPGGDGPYLYCRLLPDVPAGTLVHVHDIFLPFDYPDVYRQRGYVEQYLLHALLADSPAWEIVFATYFMSDAHPEAMKGTFGDGVAEGDFRGASFWMRRT
jgi:hypothetical protein